MGLLYCNLHILYPTAYVTTDSTIRCRPRVKLESSFGWSSALLSNERGICLRSAYTYSTRPFRPRRCPNKNGVALKSGQPLPLSWHGDPLMRVLSQPNQRCGGELLHLSSLGIDDRLTSLGSVRRGPCVFVFVFSKARSDSSLPSESGQMKYKPGPQVSFQGGRGFSHTARRHTRQSRNAKKKSEK